MKETNSELILRSAHFKEMMTDWFLALLQPQKISLRVFYLYRPTLHSIVWSLNILCLLLG